MSYPYVKKSKRPVEDDAVVMPEFAEPEVEMPRFAPTGFQGSFDDFPTLPYKSKYDAPVTPVSSYVEIQTIDLEKELLAQYNQAKRLLHDASFDTEIPLNQKSQAINTAAGILSQLTKSQADLYSSERFKKIELVLIETLKAFPDMQAAFMELYREALA